MEYSNLAPGPYRFRVIPSNNSGVWNESGDTLEFSITPAYYQTAWFRAVRVGAFLALVWGLYRARVQRLRSQGRKLREVVETIPSVRFTALPDGSNTFVSKRWTRPSSLARIRQPKVRKLPNKT